MTVRLTLQAIIFFCLLAAQVDHVASAVEVATEPESKSERFEPDSRHGKIEWSQRIIEADGFAGTSQIISVSLTSSSDRNELSVRAVPEIAEFVRVLPSDQIDLTGGVPVSLDIQFAIPKGSEPGLYDGVIQVKDGNSTIPSVLRVSVKVQSAPDDNIPGVPAFPSPDRVVLDGDQEAKYYVSDEILVGFVDGVNELEVMMIAAETGATIIGSYPSIDLFQFQLEEPSFLDDKIQSLRLDPRVSSVGRHWFLPPLKFSDDPVWNASEGSLPRWALDKMQVPSAWDIETGDASTKIAVVDTGFVPEHQDFGGSFRRIGATSPAVCQKHGTNVAGLIAAEDDDVAIVGVMWDAEVSLYSAGIPTTWLDKIKRKDLTTDCVFDIPVAIAHIEAALENDTRIISAAFGDTFDDAETARREGALMEDKIVEWNKKHDALFVFGAGNSGVDVSREVPANLAAIYDNVIAVAGIQQDGTLFGSVFNFFGGSNGGSGVDVAAPGAEVYTTDSDAANDYAYVTGTSFSSPLVTGIAGLLLSYDDSLSAKRLKQLIVEGANQGGPIVAGQTFHVANARRSLEILTSPPPPPPPPPTSERFVFTATGVFDNTISGQEGFELANAYIPAPGISTGDPVDIRIEFNVGAAQFYTVSGSHTFYEVKTLNPLFEIRSSNNVWTSNGQELGVSVADRDSGSDSFQFGAVGGDQFPGSISSTATNILNMICSDSSGTILDSTAVPVGLADLDFSELQNFGCRQLLLSRDRIDQSFVQWSAFVEIDEASIQVSIE